MSKYSLYSISIPTGCDIVNYLKDFTTAQHFQAAFVFQCVGNISKTTLRMAESWNTYEPVKEVSDLAKIESLVGTISGGDGHLHASLSGKDGDCVGGHVFGPMLASGNVEIVMGECENLVFTRAHDDRTGFPELVVEERGSQTLSESQKAISQDIDQKISYKPYTNDVNDLTIKAVYSFRLVPGDDICNGLNDFVLENKLNEPFIMTCVGSVTKAVLDVGQDKGLTMKGFYEIVSLLGTPNNLQISLSDKDGHVITGHVTSELIVFTTAELVIGDKENIKK